MKQKCISIGTTVVDKVKFKMQQLLACRRSVESTIFLKIIVIRNFSSSVITPLLGLCSRYVMWYHAKMKGNVSAPPVTHY